MDSREALVSRIYVLAGTNGAGKSSVGGAMLINQGTVYFNPDEVAARTRAACPHFTQREVEIAAAKERDCWSRRSTSDRIMPSRLRSEETRFRHCLKQHFQRELRFTFGMWAWIVQSTTSRVSALGSLAEGTISLRRKYVSVMSEALKVCFDCFRN